MNAAIRHLWWAAQLCATLVFAGAVVSAAPFTGAAVEVGTDVIHSNGNLYDQLLLNGTTCTFGANSGQITRASFVDLNGDIVQVEFSGAGSVTITLEGASGPAPAAKYQQPGVVYMKGHAWIEVTGSDATSNLTIFSVGKKTAQSQTILRDGEEYDGVADLALIHIKADPANPNGSIFGGIRAANGRFWATHDRTGIYAPKVHVQNVVRIGELSAHDEAWPVLVLGQNSQFGIIDIFGGSLAQPNNHPIEMDYAASFVALEGETSAGVRLPVQTSRFRVMRGVRELVCEPGPGPVFPNPDPIVIVPSASAESL